MQLRVLEEGAWEISKVREIEYYFLQQVRIAADPGECEPADKSLDQGGARQPHQQLLLPGKPGKIARVYRDVRV